MILVSSKRTMAGAQRIAADRLAQIIELPTPEPKIIEQPLEGLTFVYEPVFAPGRSTPHHRDVIAQVVARYPGISTKEVYGSSRAKRVVTARYEAIAEVYKHCRAASGLRLSLQRLSEMFGKKDHSSVLTALRRHGVERNRLTHGMAYPDAF